jgi:hypothetical protein
MAKAETVIKTVTMDDDRIVEFAGNRKMLKNSTVNGEGVRVRFDFVNGETRTYTLTEKLFAHFAAHGAEQKFGDEIAGLKDVEDCVNAIDELMIRLDSGKWNVARESGNSMAGSSILVKALVEASGKSVGEIKTFLAGKTQAEKAALRVHRGIAPIVQRLEAEKAAKKPASDAIDTDALLDGIL